MKNKFFILLFFSIFYIYAQPEMRINPYVKGELHYKDTTYEKGFIRLDSDYRIRFKLNEKDKKSKKIKYKTIQKIVSYDDYSGEREFYYKLTSESKFPLLVELIIADSLSLYIKYPKTIDLFYSNYDRTTLLEQMRNEKIELNDKLPPTKKIISVKKSGEPVYQYAENTPYIEFTITKLDYFVGKKNEEKLQLINSESFLYKNFRKTLSSYFHDCHVLVEKIQNKEFKKRDILEIVEFYNENCN